MDETELMFLGHVGYAAVRSAAHKFGRVREDGTLVMDHCYKTSVYIINRYLEELRNENDTEKRRKLYDQAKKGVLVGIPHDYLEDFTKLSPSFLEDKLSQQATWHTDIEGDLRIPQYPNIPERSNFFSRNKESILRMLAALTKPQPKENPHRKGYLKRQVLAEWEGGIEDQVLVFRSKVGDRLHNVRTVGIKHVSKQAEYMIETGTIFDLGKEIAKKTANELTLAPDLRSLGRALVERSSDLIPATESPETRAVLSAEIARIQGLIQKN